MAVSKLCGGMLQLEIVEPTTHKVISKLFILPPNKSYSMAPSPISKMLKSLNREPESRSWLHLGLDRGAWTWEKKKLRALILND